MTRVRSRTVSHARHRKIINRAKGYWGRRKNTFRAANQAVEKAALYAYRDRRTRKRMMRRLWIQRINAAVRLENITYGRFINGLQKAEITLNRKSLAELAVNKPNVFKDLVEQAKAQTS
jgi:large subunit ribosomal protein L20